MRDSRVATLWFKGVAAAALLLASLGCGHDAMGRGPLGPMMMTGPGVGAMLVSVMPVGGAVGVPTTTTVTIRFSQGMGSGMEQFVDLHEGDVTRSVVPMACAWSTGRTLLTCSPASGLKPGTRYAIHIGGGMRASNGFPVDLGQVGMGMGGQWVDGSVMGMHGGTPWNSMGSGWHGGNGSYGMVFNFTTAD